MKIETVGFCPLGKECQEIKDNKIYRCNWLITIAGQDPQTGQQINDESKCSIAWLPILMLETNRDVRGVQQATETFRNEMVKGNNDLLTMINPLNTNLIEKE